MKKFIYTAVLASTVLLAGCSYSAKAPSATEPATPQANTPAPSGTPFISLGKDATLGEYLTGKNGMTLYVFKKDEPNKSNCKDTCAKNWPPLEPEGAMSLAQGIPGVAGVMPRENGVAQVTYNGQPLYYWVNDKKAGDTTGQGVNGVWFVAKP